MPLNRVFLYLSLVLIISILRWAIFYSRDKETDDSGNPTLRFIGTQFVMALLGTLVLFVGIYEWLDPINHRYPGNLLILSYLPITISVFIYLFAAYCLRYRVTIMDGLIEIQRWPLPAVTYKVVDIESVQRINRQTLLHFKNMGILRVTPMLSGRKYFMERIEQSRMPGDAS